MAVAVTVATSRYSGSHIIVVAAAPGAAAVAIVIIVRACACEQSALPVKLQSDKFNSVMSSPSSHIIRGRVKPVFPLKSTESSSSTLIRATMRMTDNDNSPVVQW